MKHLRAIIFLFAANTISGFAQGITMLAIPWYLIQAPGGKFLNATMVAGVTLISLFWGVYAGTLIDRYNRKRIFQVMTLTDSVILCSIAFLGFSLGNVPVFAIIFIYGITIFTYNVHYPNLYAFVQELFEPRFYAKVNSAIEIQGQTTNFLGMMVGGILIAGPQSADWWPSWLEFEPWKLQEIFLMDGITYFIGFSFLSLIPYHPAKDKKIDKGTIRERLYQGFVYLNENRSILTFGIASHVMFFSLLPVIQIIMPVYVNDYLHENAFILSSFKGFYALGAVMAGLIGLSALVRRNNLIRQIIGLLVLAGCIYGALVFIPWIPFILGGAILLGISNAGIRILRITYLVRIVPNRVIGRVNSFFAVVNVLMRVGFSALMAIPFFSADQNGENIIYAFALLGIIMWVSAGILITWFGRFDQRFATDT